MKKNLLIINVIFVFIGCESLSPKSHHETGLHPELQGHINRQKANDLIDITDIGFDIADTFLK